MTTDTQASLGERLEAPGKTGAFSAFEWMLAGRYLRSKRRETFISVISGFSFVGIMLGVATLIIVMAVMNGFRAELLDRILGLNGHLIVSPVDGELTDYAAVADRLNGVEGVKLAVPLVEGQALVSSGPGGSGALVRGVRETDLKRIESIAGTVKAGSLDGFDTGEGIAIGIRMANQLGLTVGDLLTLISPEGDITPFGTTPRVKAYPINAIFEVGMSEYDSTFVFMPLPEAQLYFNSEGKVNVIELFLDHPDEVQSMRQPVEEAADRPLFLTDWTQRNATFFSALQVERNVMFFILTLIVLVAALNIISGLFMLVKDKGHDIAILRTMGATKGAIMRVFLITGASIGVIGTIAGLILGVVFCWNIEEIRLLVQAATGTTLMDPKVYYLSKLPADIDLTETAWIVVFALVLTLLATLYPSWRASKLDPVEALRYE